MCIKIYNDYCNLLIEIAAKKHYEGFKEHALTDSEEKEANWQNIVKELETQRDRLYLKNRIKDEGKLLSCSSLDLISTLIYQPFLTGFPVFFY